MNPINMKSRKLRGMPAGTGKRLALAHQSEAIAIAWKSAGNTDSALSI